MATVVSSGWQNAGAAELVWLRVDPPLRVPGTPNKRAAKESLAD